MGRAQTGEVAPTGSRAQAPAEEGEPTGAGLDARMREAARRELREFEKQTCPPTPSVAESSKSKGVGTARGDLAKVMEKGLAGTTMPKGTRTMQ